jgi:hypothetical protein
MTVQIASVVGCQGLLIMVLCSEPGMSVLCGEVTRANLITFSV